MFLGQCFSTRGNFASPPGNNQQHLETFLIVTTWKWAVMPASSGQRPGMLLEVSQSTGQCPTKGGYLIQTVDSAEAEKPCSSAPNRRAFLERTSKRMDRKWTNSKLTWRGLLRRKIQQNKKEEWLSQKGTEEDTEQRPEGSEEWTGSCWVWWTKAPWQGTQASSGEGGGPCRWTAVSREPVVEIGSESDWDSLVSHGHLLAPRAGALVEDIGHAFVHNLSVPHAWWNQAEEDTKLTYILAQGRQFPVLWNLHKTHCHYFVLVWGRKWV